MKLLILVAAIAVATATVVKDDTWGVTLTKDTLATVDVKTRELLILKLLNHVLQPTMYDDVRDVAREWNIEENFDKYLKTEMVREFLDMYRMGMLPRGEVFVHTSTRHMREAVRVFRLLYFTKDFDVLIRTACWLRERINPGMFVYALTAVVFHRTDCRGITLPAPYEIYPYFFVDSNIINKAVMMKMTKAITDPMVTDYFGIKITENNLVVLDWRKGLRTAMTTEDRFRYFTEDIDLNTYMYYLHMNYPYWMTDDVYGLNKERRGEVLMYGYQQLLARFRLERYFHGVCDVKMLMFNEPLKLGYWPKLRLHNGYEMPVRSNDVRFLTKENIRGKIMIEELETFIREGIMRGKIELRDGTVLNVRKAEDVELLGRLILGGLNFARDDAKFIHLVTMLKRLLTYNFEYTDKYTYVPTVLDMYSTCLRDPVFWRIMRRLDDMFVLFKKLLPTYTREELDFPGVRVDQITTDKLVTFMDEYDIDITNAMYLDKVELQKKRSDMLFVARMRRLNHHPFKVNIDVTSDKAADAVVRVFIGPKYDCVGRLLSLHDRRMGMVEIDSFVHKLDTGKNTIVRDSREFHGVIDDRIWTRRIWDKVLTNTVNTGERMVDHYWYKTRIGFPRRLLLPLGTLGGVPLTVFVIVTPVRTGLTLPLVDINVMKERRSCYWTVCVDTMPLGFPFDREIDMTRFFTNNMKFTDVMVYRKDMTMANKVKDVDMSDMIMRRDDLCYLDTDMLVRFSYRDVTMTGVDNMTRM